MIANLYESTYSRWWYRWLYPHIVIRHGDGTVKCSTLFGGLSLPCFFFCFIQLCARFILSHPEALCFLFNLRMKTSEQHNLCRGFRKISVATCCFLQLSWLLTQTELEKKCWILGKSHGFPLSSMCQWGSWRTSPRLVVWSAIKKEFLFNGKGGRIIFFTPGA